MSRGGLIEALGDALDRAGVVATFDGRRYARAARSWPDYLPPMFGHESVAVERWGMTSFDGIWVARRPEAWPAPTVAIGETYEQKSALLATWEEAERAVGMLRIVRHTIVAIHGERFINERGHDLPWSMVNPLHWRLVDSAAAGRSRP